MRFQKLIQVKKGLLAEDLLVVEDQNLKVGYVLSRVRHLSLYILAIINLAFIKLRSHSQIQPMVCLFRGRSKIPFQPRGN